MKRKIYVRIERHDVPRDDGLNSIPNNLVWVSDFLDPEEAEKLIEKIIVAVEGVFSDGSEFIDD